MHPDNMMFCPACGTELVYVQQTTPPPYGSNNPTCYNSYDDNAFSPSGPQGKSRGVAGLLAILLGGLGVQYFYLGKVGGGLLTILLTICTCGIWDILMLIQGILMLCMTNTEFQRKYVDNTSTMPLF